MISYRPFQNGDPPALAKIWREQPPLRGMAQKMSVNLLDIALLSKPYFERNGLILAFDDGEPVGFVHAGFGPDDQLKTLDERRGVISMLMVTEHPEKAEIASKLLELGEQYLRPRAEEIFGIGVGTLCPFYLGLYGGSHLPGILASDTTREALFRAAGYEEVDRINIYQCDLPKFRAPIDRDLMQLRRSTVTDVIIDPPPATWWEACTLGCFEQIVFEVEPRTGDGLWASAKFWLMEPLSQGVGFHIVGLHGINVYRTEKQEVVATLLLSEALKELATQGVAAVEGQAMAHDNAANAMFERLGFHQIDTGIVLRT